MPDPKTSPHDSVCQTRGHDCDEVDALRAQVAELEGLLSRSHDESMALCARIAELEQIDNQRITETMSQEGRADRYRETIREFLSTVLTIKRENEPEWMEYLAERINEVCEVIGEEDRVAYNPRQEAILPIKK